MLFKFEICLNAIPNSPLFRYITGQSLKDAIRKADRTLLRVRGKKVAHIISVEEVDYGMIVPELSANYTYASGYNISTVNYFTAYSTAAEVNYSASTDFNTSVFNPGTFNAEVSYNNLQSVYYAPNSTAQSEQYYYSYTY